MFSSELSRILPADTAYVCDASFLSYKMVFCFYGVSLMDALYDYSYFDVFIF